MARSPRKNPKKSSGSDHHHVYVVFLRNPAWKGRTGWYVGMTGLTPEQRFENHKNGIRAARMVRKYGVRLVPKLYDAVGKLAEHFDRLGQRLRGAIDAYNDAIGSLEGNVLVKARKFKDARLSNGDELKALEPIDRQPRMLQASELTTGLPFVDGSVSTEEPEEVERV